MDVDVAIYVTALHEVYHAFGVWHEKNRPDGDDYLRVFLYDNIQLNHKRIYHNIDSQGTTYDYYSITHLESTIFKFKAVGLRLVQWK